MPWEFVDGAWDRTRLTEEERAYERQRWKDNVLIWSSDWIDDPRAIKLDLLAHPYFHVRRIQHSSNGRAVARANTRASGNNVAENWIVVHGTGIVRMKEEVVVVSQGKAVAVVTHYWFEDAATGMMFKMLWSGT